MENYQNKIKVISYNIHSGKNIWMVPQLKFVAHYLKANNFDVIGLQEINENNKRGNQVSFLHNYLHYDYQFAPNIKLGKGHYGLASFSKHEIINKEHLFLTSKKEQRGLINTTLLIDGKIVHLLNTHLSLNKEDRMVQLAEIKQYINGLDQPTILMGDFNITETNLDEMLIDTAKETKKEHLSTLMLSNKRIDYIYVSSHFKVLSYHVIQVKMSDHYPVVVELTFKS